MIRSAGRSAALLPLLLLLSACATSSPASPGPSSSGPSSSAGPATWVSVDPSADADRPDVPATDRPKRIAADADLCELLLEEEIKAATGAPYARRGKPVAGTLCVWQLSDVVGDQGTPTEMLMLTSMPAGTWLGEEQGVVGGYPTRKRIGDGMCALKVALRRPEAPTDKVVLVVNLTLADKTTNPCPAAQKLAETALPRVPGA
ncbi:DUF3558 family protein [Saccharothrix variisporea]|uniref:DUF3558 family protein n=1 Tax=Saccharothrix variisporea TaxID=543527 RepID=UPI001476E55F|nr:DUF3558 family protein [Saccharothrix variisporea]